MRKFLAAAFSAFSVMVCATGCSKGAENVEAQSYSSEGKTVNGVKIEVRDKEIEVSLSDDRFVHIDYYESDTEYYNISVSEDGILTMTAEDNEGLGKYFGIKSSDDTDKISLQVPEAVLSTLELSTTNEDLSLCELTVTDRISLSNNKGDISFGELSVGSVLEIENKNADISGSVSGSYEDYTVSCKVKKGESNLLSGDNGGTKRLEVTDNNGDVEIDFLPQ